MLKRTILKTYALFRLGLLASSSNNRNSTYGYIIGTTAVHTYKYNYTLKVLCAFNVCYGNIIITQWPITYTEFVYPTPNTLYSFILCSRTLRRHTVVEWLRRLEDFFFYSHFYYRVPRRRVRSYTRCSPPSRFVFPENTSSLFWGVNDCCPRAHYTHTVEKKLLIRAPSRTGSDMYNVLSSWLCSSGAFQFPNESYACGPKVLPENWYARQPHRGGRRAYSPKEGGDHVVGTSPRVWAAGLRGENQ